MSTPTVPPAVQLFDNGLTDLVSILPPNAPLQNGSRIPHQSLGKAPGRRLESGVWVGYDWRRNTPTRAEVVGWASWNANIGLRTTRYPAIDVDCLDEELARTIENEARRFLGDAPVRTGLAPKRLLLYSVAVPFKKVTLTFTRDGVKHAVEVLGDGQQCVVYGIHPKSMRPYQWDRDIDAIRAETLRNVDEAAARAFLGALAQKLTSEGWSCNVSPGGRRTGHSVQVHGDLHAPTINALREAVAFIPNDENTDYHAYIKMGLAIKAAAGKDLASGLDIFLKWASRWEGGYNDPENVKTAWGGFIPNGTVGWGWIADQAQEHGFNAAAYEFTAIEVPESAPRTEIAAIDNSDQDIAIRFAKRHASLLRHIPQSRKWRYWDGTCWLPDEILRAPDQLKVFLRGLGDIALRGTLDNRVKDAAAQAYARRLSSAKIAREIMQLAASDARLTATSDQFDQDPWALNTKSGIVDLRSGELRAHDPSGMMSKIASTTVGSSADCPRWMAFLAETTDNDAELIAYLHRLAGYILTGSTREQSFTFIYGTGGNGKSVFIDTLLHVLGDYGRTAPMSVFMAKGRNEHPTELAGLQGARLVAANETNTNGAWDEARLKILSGGDRIAARFMRGDYYEYTPNFKLVVVGNVKPTFSSVDAATRRRLHLVSFEHTPLVPDRDLLDKLRLESPGILAWMIEGCLAWQEEGLNPPRAVLKATKEYLDDQDLLGRWMSDCCHIGPEYREQSSKLFDSFTTWCGESREVALSQRQFVMQLKARGFPKYQDSRDRGLRGLKGLALREFESSAEGASLAAEEAA